MAKTEAISIRSIDSSTVTDDGKHAFLRLFTLSGDELTLAFPAETLSGLMQCVSDAAGKARRIAQNDPRAKTILPTEQWEIAPHEDQIVMSFQLLGGMEMSFQIHRDAAEYFRETLAAVLGDESTVPDNDTSRH